MPVKRLSAVSCQSFSDCDSPAAAAGAALPSPAATCSCAGAPATAASSAEGAAQPGPRPPSSPPLTAWLSALHEASTSTPEGRVVRRVPGHEDSRAGCRVTKILTPGAGFRPRPTIRPQSAVTRVAAPSGAWSCGRSPRRPAPAIPLEHFAWRLHTACTPRPGSAAMAACAVADSVINGCSQREEAAAAAAAAAANTPQGKTAWGATQPHGATKPTSSPRHLAPRVLADGVLPADAGFTGIAVAGRFVPIAPRIARGSDKVPFASVRVFDRPSSALRVDLSLRVRY